MTPDAALDHLAFFVGLRLMGPDARRRLRITLLRHKDVAAPAHRPADRLERLDALLDGRRTPEPLQDRPHVALALRARNASSQQRRVGKECVRTCISRWSTHP